MTYTIARFVQLVFDFYNILIIVYCLLSWLPRSTGGLIDDLNLALESIVGRFLNVFRQFIPPVMGVDFSPIVAILALSIIERLVLNIIL